MPVERDGYELRHYVGVARRRSLSIVVPAVLLAVLGWLLGSSDVEYASTASVLAAPSQSASSVIADVVTETSVEDEVAILTSDDVRSAVETRLGHPPDVVVEQRSTESSVVSITASGEPDAVQDDAQVYAETYVELRRAQLAEAGTIAVEQLTARLTDIGAQLAQLAESIATVDAQIEVNTDPFALRDLAVRREQLLAQRDALNDRRAPIQPQLDELALAAAVNPTSGIELLSGASEPVVASGATRAQYAAAGALVGLVLGVLLAFAREQLDLPARRRREVKPRAEDVALDDRAGYQSEIVR